MYEVVLVRHGQSTWNAENLFTGWVDVDLSSQGVEEAQEAGRMLKEKGFSFDMAFTSELQRATKTCDAILNELGLSDIPVTRAWRLNERHYGGLQGLNKKETAEKYGDDQVHIWRRSYDTPPPEVSSDDPEYQKQVEFYSKLDVEVPKCESLKLTLERVLPYWESEIAPAIKSGKKLIIAAHGNSLRAIVKHIDGISDDEITKLNIPTGNPIIYKLDENLKGIEHYYLK